MKSLLLSLQRRVKFVREMSPHMDLFGVLALQFVGDWNRMAEWLRPAWAVQEINVRPKGYETAVAVRVGSSDFPVFLQVFVWQQYLPVKEIQDPEVIVDCGANAGYSALFFLKHFPRARVIAVEPDAGNAELCRRNVRQYEDRVVVVEKALWGSVAKLGFVEGTRSPGEEWGRRVGAIAANREADAVDAIDIPNLMAMTGVKRIDLLKIDIEESEVDVFRSNPDKWLDRVGNIAIELHGPACSNVFRSALSHYSFTETQCGEVTLCLGLHPRVNGFASMEGR